MYLHENREQFKDIVEQVSAENGRCGGEYPEYCKERNV